MFKLMKIHVVDLLTKNRQWIFFTALVVKRVSVTSNWIAQSLFLSAFVCSSVCPRLLWSPNNMQCNSSSAVCFNWIRTKFRLSMPINSVGQPHCDISITHACRLTSGFRGPSLSLTDFHQIWNKDSFHIFKPVLVCDRKQTVLHSACAKIDTSGCFEVLLILLRMQMKNQPRTSEYSHQIWHVNIQYY